MVKSNWSFFDILPFFEMGFLITPVTWLLIETVV